jgi:hypothetical protein
MGVKKEISKYDYDVNLFLTEPPETKKLVKSLFCGRKNELKRCVSILKNSIDVKGKRFLDKEKKPWIIHGESRSGKSHLARRVLYELPQNMNRIQIIIPAKERLEAISVMSNLFEELRDEFYSRITQSIENEHPWVHFIYELITQISFFIGRCTESITFKVSKAMKESMSVGGKFSLVPNFIEFSLNVGAEKSESDSLELRLHSPNAFDMAEYCGVIINTLIQLELIHHVFVLIDDVDLLVNYENESENGKKQRSELSQAILKLNSTPGIDILITARSWYGYSNKEYITLEDLTIEPLSNDDLILIHDCRFKYYGKRGLNNRFLTDDALLKAANEVGGMPGVFLQHLNTAFRKYQKEDDWEERSYEWYFTIFQEMYNLFREKCPAAASALEEAAQNDLREIDVRKANPFYGTVFDNEFVFQSYYSETTYFIDSLVLNVIMQSINK